ncbi:hypothetical protein GCM10009754_28350 [Amycolatopsis minnesotensis]|uniref:Integrase n=1 Tax=Amycolatopsis minnesotensis TaxID=337894 RepID=A0ABN2QR92_9PSEU
MVELAGEGLVVRFEGRDGRARGYDFAELPVPGMRAELAAAFAVRTGYTGTLHTLSSANNAWQSLRRFAVFLAKLPGQRPDTIGEITQEHLRRFRLDRLATMSEVAVMAEMRRICRVLMEVPAEQLRPDTRAWLATSQLMVNQAGPRGVPGYSDEVFAQIVRAARSDVARIRDRIRAGERLLAAALSGRGGLSPQQRREAAELVELAATGEVPRFRFPTGAPHPWARMDYASRLFLVSLDLAPLLVLGVAVSGRNGETIKELPAEHRRLDDQAVQVQAVKRRRGAGHWFADVVWEIGSPSRQLHTPGGLYLLLLELTARSRAFSGSATAWSVWFNGGVRDAFAGGGHADPFAANLSRGLALGRWARRHELTENGASVQLTLNRLKTTVERRTTRAVGGHLPPAIRTNTQDVLFSSYLAGDPTVRDWAEDVVADAVSDAEAAARAAHQRVLDGSGGPLPVVEADADRRAATTVFT